MFSNSSALFCTRQTLNPFVFKQFRTLLQKTPGVGGALRFLPLCFLAPPFGDASTSSHNSFTLVPLSKECLTTLVKSEGSALFPKTAGCTPTIPNLELATRHSSLATCFPLSRVTSHGSPVTSPATLFHPWLANDSANTSLPISTGARRSRAPFAFRRIPLRPSPATSVLCESRFIGTSIAGSKSVQDTVK